MRTLTQVWVFLVTLTFLFLIIGFQLLGRVGLFITFILSLLFLYAALRNSLHLFRGPLNPQLFSGNDPTGFLTEIEKNKLKFGFRRIHVYITERNTPPLVWKNTEDKGYILLNEQLLFQLKNSEIRLLAIFLLSHLENRSFVAVQLLSLTKIPVIVLSIISKGTAVAIHKIFKSSLAILTADQKFISMAETNKFDAGYFINKLHQLNFNQFQTPNSYSFFSTLSLPENIILNEFGIPNLKVRLKKIMGFSI